MVREIDLLERLRDAINELDLTLEGMKLTCKLGGLEPESGLAIMTAPNWRVVRQDYSGLVTVEAGFDVSIKARKYLLAHKLLQKISSHLTAAQITSDNESFVLRKIQASAQPAAMDQDERGVVTYSLLFLATFEINVI